MSGDGYSVTWSHNGDCAAAVAATEVRRMVTRERDQALADLARAQATIAAVRALCDEVDYDPALMPRVSTRDLRRALDGG